MIDKGDALMAAVDREFMELAKLTRQIREFERETEAKLSVNQEKSEGGQ